MLAEISAKKPSYSRHARLTVDGALPKRRNFRIVRIEFDLSKSYKVKVIFAGFDYCIVLNIIYYVNKKLKLEFYKPKKHCQQQFEFKILDNYE